MKMAKRVLSIMMVLVTIVSVVSISAEAASVSTAKLSLGYMVPTNAKGTKALESTNLYGTYDYLNFYIKATKKEKTYFFYEIYSDSKMTKYVDGGSVMCEYGEYSWSPEIKLKGKYKTKTYYAVTYAAKVYSSGSVKIDTKSVNEFKIKVNRTNDFEKRVITLNSVTNTKTGPKIKWDKISGVSKYYIYRRNIDGTKWTKVGSVSSKNNYFTDTSVKNKNGNYIYTVKAINKKGDVTRYHYSGLVCLFAKAPLITSVSTTYNNEIKIEWDKTKTGAKYTVMRREVGGEWETLKKSVTTTSYTDKKAQNNKTYQYTVKASFSTDYGTATSSYHSTNGNKIKFLAAPELNPVNVVETGVHVSWNQVEGVSAYKIFRRPLDKSESWTELGTVDSTVLEFIDNTANLECSYIYTVRSEGDAGRGSYYSKGVNYHKLAKPQIISTGIYSYNDYHSVSWEKIKYATEYYLYKKNSENTWELVGTFEATDYDTQYGRVEPEKYVSTEYCVQAGYNDTLRSELSDSAFINEYPYSKYVTENRVEYNYIKILVNSKADKYNVYKGVEGQESSQYELVTTFDITGSEDVLEYKDYDFTNETKYVIKGVFEGIEQSNFKEFSIQRIEEPAETRNESVSCESYSNNGFKVAINHPEYDGYYAYYYFYDYATSEWIDVWSHYSNGNNHYIYEDNFPDDFQCSPEGEYKLSIVYGKYGDAKKTSIDANIMTFKRFYAPIKNFTADAAKNGAKITWNAVEGVSKYIVKYSVDDVEKSVEVIADGSETYSTVLEADIDRTGHIEYSTTIICEYTENSASTHKMPELRQCGTPKINKTKYYSKTGIAELYFGEHQGTACEYTIYRKEKGDTSWKIVKEHAEFDAYSSTYGEAVWDRTAKPGKTYIYTLRISCRYENSDDLIYVRSYYDKEGTVCKT